jgi:hypothetical protein
MVRVDCSYWPGPPGEEPDAIIDVWPGPEENDSVVASLPVLPGTHAHRWIEDFMKMITQNYTINSLGVPLGSPSDQDFKGWESCMEMRDEVAPIEFAQIRKDVDGLRNFGPRRGRAYGHRGERRW